MSYKYLIIPLLILGLWIGYFLFQNAQERSRVDRLPKKVSILGPYSAKAGLTEAERIALLWDAESQLQCVFMAFGGDPGRDDPGMGLDGIPIPPSGWNYRFFSAARGWFLDLTLWPDGRCEASSFHGINYLDTRPLPEGFLDSTAAVAIAEELYGEKYRERGNLFRLSTRLTTWRSQMPGPLDPVTHRPTWQLHYLTTREQGRVDLYLTLDAVTGEELCAVEVLNTKSRVLMNKYQK